MDNVKHKAQNLKNNQSYNYYVSEMSALIEKMRTSGTNEYSYCGFLILKVRCLNVLSFWSSFFCILNRGNFPSFLFEEETSAQLWDLDM